VARLLRIVLGIVLGLVLLVLLGAAGGWFWATSERDALQARTFDIPSHTFPVPFPLTEAEREALRAERLAATNAATDPAAAPPQRGDPGTPAPDPLEGVDLDALALERAVARGQHLMEARYACALCHGADLGGATMIDSAMIGTLKGPNLTSGNGSVTKDYSVVDWDRKVRHGVNRDNTPGYMPSSDFFAMTDQELSDIVAYVRSVPPVDRQIEPPRFGPLGTVLVATGQIPFSADQHPGHDAVHVVEPPPAAVTIEFGKHLSGVCTGCHNPQFNGGPITGGDPAWPPASNLTQHEQGLAAWKAEDFANLMRKGVRPDGTPVKMPMAEVLPMGAAMTDVEMQALFLFLQSLPPLPDVEA
jgi:mono/diheme cytochrome c family protein